MSAALARRRWWVPEVVQTSAMDCGPAALKCVLEGFYIPVSYGRLREACQTDVDGTSIDTLEVVARQLGVMAEQVMIPLDHLLLREAAALPAVVVVRKADGATHFVVVWRRHGPWLQVMDPAAGRRWVRRRAFLDEVFRHAQAVPAEAWRQWAASKDFLAPLRQRLARLGAARADSQALIERARDDAGWFSFGALDAAVRLVDSVVSAGGLRPGKAALALLHTLFQRTCANSDDIFRAIPASYWSALPDAASSAETGLLLTLRGAVLLRIPGRVDGTAAAAEAITDPSAAPPPLSRELKAALSERAESAAGTVWRLLRQDGLLAPLAMGCAIALTAGAMMLETLLFRGLFDLAGQLNGSGQRLQAALALLAFVGVLLALQVPIVTESLRYGRQLEMRLRMALLAKLPRLPDRYFQSRLVSDMAERSHGIHLSRLVPGLGLQFLQALAKLLLTLLGITLIAPHAGPWALLIALLAMAMTLVAQPLLAERDMRLRSHGGALLGFYLDALLGLVPVRTHRAEQAVRRQHEGLLVAWVAAGRALVVASLSVGTTQALLCSALAGGLLVQHFVQAGGVGGGDLLLVFWILRLPATGIALMSLAQQYPSQRNALLRLMEPLSAPEDPGVAASAAAGPARPAAGAAQALAARPAATGRGARPPEALAAPRGMALDIHQGSVRAGGHTLLHDIHLQIKPGEQVAIVGMSGAGKSTLIGLLLGWHRLAGGSLRVDGAALDAAGQVALRRQTAWVDPGIQLWNRSFLDNLGYASDDEALARVGPAIQAAGLRGVLQKLPAGLQTALGEGGALLSGGEGQRVRLGRALLQDGVRLALLDEPCRGLDRPQRAALLAEARRWWQGVTLLCVTHDVAETLAFGRVLVIDNGRIVEDGVPTELAAGPSHYRALLDAEERVRHGLWQGSAWRSIRIEGGRALEVPRPLADAAGQRPRADAAGTDAPADDRRPEAA